jgi:glycosyltransferase involved in cell wall biosynthesis
MDRLAESTPLVSVVVPAYNEALSLAELVQETAVALAGTSFEMIIVDDGSSDGTWEVIAGLSGSAPLTGIRLTSNQGKAAALAAGFAQCAGRFVATMDADLQDDPAEIRPMIELADREGFDVVSGWKKKRRDPAGKRIPSKLFNLVVRMTTGVKLHDFNCGLKVYRRKVTDSLELYGEMHRYTPVLAAHHGFRIGEKAVNHRERRHGHTKYGVSRYFRGFSDLLTVLFLHRYSYRPLHFFGGIGTFLTLAGFVISAYMSVLWFSGESIGRRPLLLLGILLLVVGFQFISLGLLGEMVLKLSRRKPFTISQKTGEDGTRGSTDE